MPDSPEAAAPLNSFDPNAAATPGSGVYGLLTSPADAKVVLLPVPVDATTSYRRGASRGPAAILEASRQVDLFDLHNGRPYELGIAMLDEDPRLLRWNEEARAMADPIIAAGGLFPGRPAHAEAAAAVLAFGERVNAFVYAEVVRLLAEDRLVGVVGGDHSVPFGAIQAMAERFPGLGVLHVDAHADLRVAYEGFTWSHASIMHNVLSRIPGVSRLVGVGIRDLGEDEYQRIQADSRVTAWFDAELQAEKLGGRPWTELCTSIVSALPAAVYVSFDIDGLDPVLCPHTGTPVPGGLSFSEMVLLLAALVDSGRRIVGFDLNEVAPGPEGDDWDANVGARVLYKLIGFALRSQGLCAPVGRVLRPTATSSVLP